MCCSLPGATRLPCSMRCNRAPTCSCWWMRIAPQGTAPYTCPLPTWPRVRVPRGKATGVTSFSWLRKEGPFAALPGTPLLEMEYLPVAPDAVLVVNSLGGQQPQLGQSGPGLDPPARLAVGRDAHGGHVTMTTFSLPAHVVASDVVAQALLAGMVQL